MTDILRAYLFSDEFRGRSARDQSGCDHNVYISALFKEELHFGFNEFFRHFLSISPSSRPIFLNFNLDELGTERLNLFPCCRTCIKTSSDGSKSAGLYFVNNNKTRS
jgi:hypothetical protein